MDSFSYLIPVCCSMSSSNCCFLTCIQISQEAGQVVCYSHLSQNFPQFIVIHTVKGFGTINEAEIDVFLELSCFFHDPADVGNLISGSSAFSKTSLNIKKFMVHVWIWVNSGSWWWTGRPGMLRFMGSQRVGHDWATVLNWTEQLSTHTCRQILHLFACTLLSLFLVSQFFLSL